MDLITVSTKPIALLTITLGSTIFFILLLQPHKFSPKPDSMARSFVLWLHGLGDSGPANEPIKTLFTSPEFRNTIWKFPSAPSNPVTCNCESFWVFILFFWVFDSVNGFVLMIRVKSLIWVWLWAVFLRVLGIF